MNVYPQHGVTLVEQIMVVAILAVLACVATPALRSLLTRGRAQSAQLGFITTLQYARSTAAQSGSRVIVCPTRDALRCIDEVRWDGGWLVGIDNNHDNQPDNAPLLVGAAPAGVVVQSTAGRRHVTFTADGFAGGNNVTLVICPTDATQSPLTVAVSIWGRVRGGTPDADQAAVCRRG